jgi:hypothetical protein
VPSPGPAPPLTRSHNRACPVLLRLSQVGARRRRHSSASTKQALGGTGVHSGLLLHYGVRWSLPRAPATTALDFANHRACHRVSHRPLCSSSTHRACRRRPPAATAPHQAVAATGIPVPPPPPPSWFEFKNLA